jgi:hypothetical protein
MTGGKTKNKISVRRLRMELHSVWCTCGSVYRSCVTFLNNLRSAVENRQLVINDVRILKGMRNLTHFDADELGSARPRRSTRHFDLLMGCAVAWQMRKFARVHTRLPTVRARTSRPMSEANPETLRHEGWGNCPKCGYFHKRRDLPACPMCRHAWRMTVPFEQPAYEAPGLQ